MARVPRRVRGAGGHAVLRPITVEIIFQSYPGNEAASAISGLNYQVRPPRRGRPRNGTTGADGKVTINLWPGQLTRLNAIGTDYQLRPRRRLEPSNRTRGIQRRLNMLGYNAGTVDGTMGPKTEYAVLNYQADNNPLLVDGLPGPRTQGNLRTKVGE